MPGPHPEGSRIALIVQPSNAESPTPMYIKRTAKMAVVITTPLRGVPVALPLTISLNLRDSQDVKPKAFRKRLLYVCVPPYVITQGLSAFLARTIAKIGIIIESTKLFNPPKKSQAL